jgi:hypothetical protein
MAELHGPVVEARCACGEVQWVDPAYVQLVLRWRGATLAPPMAADNRALAAHWLTLHGWGPARDTQDALRLRLTCPRCVRRGDVEAG